MTRKRRKAGRRKCNAYSKATLPAPMAHRLRVATCISDDSSANLGKPVDQRDETQVHDFRKFEAHPSQPAWVLAKPVFIVGFMGAGKTSVARKLARFAGISSIDMDTYIERYCDEKIKDIFAKSGEAAFREIESSVLDELVKGDPILVSCGGGVVVNEENRKLLAEEAYVVHLKVTATEAAGRISNIASRPLFGDIQHAESVRLSRSALYEEVADITIDTAGRSSKSVVHEVFERLVEEGILWQRK